MRKEKDRSREVEKNSRMGGGGHAKGEVKVGVLRRSSDERRWRRRGSVQFTVRSSSRGLHGGGIAAGCSGGMAGGSR